MIKKALIGLDSTPFTETAIRHAVGLAKTYGVELTGVAVVHTSKLEFVGPDNHKEAPPSRESGKL